MTKSPFVSEVESLLAWEHLERQPWFRAGIRLLGDLRGTLSPQVLATLAWIVPPDALPAGVDAGPILAVPVRVVDGVTPHLGFALPAGRVLEPEPVPSITESPWYQQGLRDREEADRG